MLGYGLFSAGDMLVAWFLRESDIIAYREQWSYGSTYKVRETEVGVLRPAEVTSKFGGTGETNRHEIKIPKLDETSEAFLKGKAILDTVARAERMARHGEPGITIMHPYMNAISKLEREIKAQDDVESSAEFPTDYPSKDLVDKMEQLREMKKHSCATELRVDAKKFKNTHNLSFEECRVIDLDVEAQIKADAERYSSEVHNNNKDGHTISKEAVKEKASSSPVASAKTSSADTSSSPLPLTAKQWLASNPLKAFMIGTMHMGCSAVSIGSGLKTFKIQRLLLGLEEPNKNEYCAIANLMDMSREDLKGLWEVWFEKTPDNIFEGSK